MTLLTNRRILPEPGETLFIRARLDDAIIPIATELRAFRGSSLVLEVGAGAKSLPGKQDMGWREFEIVFIRANGLFRFISGLRRSWPTAFGEMLVVDGPRSVDHLQRRREVRQPIRVTTRIRTNGQAGFTRGENVWIVDLSAVGAKIECSSPLRHGDILSIDVPVGKEGAIETVRALVLDCVGALDSGESGSSRFSARLEFDDDESVRLPLHIRDEIATYVFEQQRLALKIRKLISSPTGCGPAGAKKTRLLTNMLDWMRAPSKRWKL
jgi:hypothetical protein